MRTIVLAVMLVALAACGDPATEDQGRGYTKAPLENPGLMVDGEPTSPMKVAAALEPGLRATSRETEPAGQRGGAEAAEPASDVGLAPGVTQEQYAQGEELFGGTGGCMACHGPNGSGSQLAPPLDDAEWLNLEDPGVSEIADLIRNGVAEPVEYPAPMPAMGGASLNAEQVEALAAYVASISGG